MWTSVILDIDSSDDLDVVVNKLRRYVRKRRNPLLDRKLFHGRNQYDQYESIDQYLADLVRLYNYNACAYEAENIMCETCSRSCGHAGRLRDKGLRER